jgi:hypothetical protein
MNNLVFCVPCNMKMDIDDCFNHKQTKTHITKFEKIKLNKNNKTITMIMQNGILFTSEEERQKTRDYRQKKKLEKSNNFI